MSRLQWDLEGQREYETGVSNGVLYVYDTEAKKYGKGVAWNGLSSITDSPEGAEANDIYADNSKYLSLYSAEKFGATIEAYMYPDEFKQCDGTAVPVAGMNIGQQTRKSFCLAYETIVGNDTEGNDYGKKIHIIYGCRVSPSEQSHETVNDSPEAGSFSWEVSTTPLPAFTLNGVEYKPTATLVIDSTEVAGGVTGDKWKAIEAVVYGKNPTTEGGSDGKDPEVLYPAKAYEILSAEG